MNPPEYIPELVSNENVVICGEFYCCWLLRQFSNEDSYVQQSQLESSQEHTSSSGVPGTLDPILSSAYRHRKLRYTFYHGLSLYSIWVQT